MLTPSTAPTDAIVPGGGAGRGMTCPCPDCEQTRPTGRCTVPSLASLYEAAAIDRALAAELGALDAAVQAVPATPLAPSPPAAGVRGAVTTRIPRRAA